MRSTACGSLNLYSSISGRMHWDSMRLDPEHLHFTNKSYGENIAFRLIQTPHHHSASIPSKKHRLLQLLQACWVHTGHVPFRSFSRFCEGHGSTNLALAPFVQRLATWLPAVPGLWAKRLVNGWGKGMFRAVFCCLILQFWSLSRLCGYCSWLDLVERRSLSTAGTGTNTMDCCFLDHTNQHHLKTHTLKNMNKETYTCQHMSYIDIWLYYYYRLVMTNSSFIEHGPWKMAWWIFPDDPSDLG